MISGHGRCVEDGYVSLSYVTRLASEDRPDLRDVEAAFLAR